MPQEQNLDAEVTNRLIADLGAGRLEVIRLSAFVQAQAREIEGLKQRLAALPTSASPGDMPTAE